MAGLLSFPRASKQERRIQPLREVKMARKPNYGFERREREKAKAEKKAERLKAKQERRGGEADEAPFNDAEDGAPTEGA
jgi:hypothetical protein